MRRFKLPIILLNILIIVNTSVIAQNKKILEIPIDSETNKVSLGGIVELSDIKKEELYSRVYNWYFQRLHNLAEEVSNNKLARIQMITMNAGIDSTSQNRNKISFYLELDRDKLRKDNSFRKDLDGYEKITLNIWFKDNRLKFDFTNFSHTAFGFSNVSTANTVYETEKFSLVRKKVWEEFKLENINFCQAIAEEIENYIKITKNKDDKNW